MKHGNLVVMTAVFLFAVGNLSAANAQDASASLVSGAGHSRGLGSPVKLVVIPKKHVFTGTLIARTIGNGYDFVIAVHVDLRGNLRAEFRNGAVEIEVSPPKKNSVSFSWGGNQLGTLSYDSSSREIRLEGPGKGRWLQGVLMGMIASSKTLPGTQ